MPTNQVDELLPGWFKPTTADIDLIKTLVLGDVIEPFCGNGYLLSVLDGNRTGIDSDGLARDSGTVKIIKDHLETYLNTPDGQDTWKNARTVICCYPPCGYLFSDPALIAVKSVMEHQRLLLITPQPFDNVMIAGTPAMWNYVFFHMDLISKYVVGTPANKEMLYVLEVQRGDKTAGFTKEAILGDKVLWNLDMDENYMFKKKARRDVRK